MTATPRRAGLSRHTRGDSAHVDGLGAVVGVGDVVAGGACGAVRAVGTVPFTSFFCCVPIVFRAFRVATIFALAAAWASVESGVFALRGESP